MMQIRLKYILLFFLLLLFSCSDREDKPVPLLLRADSLIRINCADSALHLLESNPLQEQLTTPASRAQYALLLTQARDKNYILHTNDSLIRVAVRYYDSIADVASQAKAHYYWGRVYQDMNNVAGTAREFLVAMPLAEEVKDYDLTCLLQGNLGYLFWEHGLFDEADSLYKCAGRLAEEQKDSLRWALLLSKRADICLDKGDEYYAEAETHLKQALTIIESSTLKNAFIEREVLCSLGYLYERTGRFPEAISLVRRRIVLQPDTTQLYVDYLLLGSAYYKMEQYDSAMVYLDRCLYSDNYGVKEGAYMRLSDIAKIQGRERDALLFDTYYMAYKDSSKVQEKPVKVVSSIKEILHQQSVAQYESSLHRYRYSIFAVGITLLVVVSFFLYRQWSGKRKMNKLLEEQKLVSSCLAQSRQLLEQKEAEINMSQLRYDECNRDRQNQVQSKIILDELLKEKDVMLATKKELLQKQADLIAELSKKKFKELIAETSIYRKLQALGKENTNNPDLKKKPDAADWDELAVEIDRSLPNFTLKLRGQYEQLLEDDIRLCCLIRLGLKYSEINNILACTLDTVYKREKSILHKMQVDSKMKLKLLLNEL